MPSVAPMQRPERRRRRAYQRDTQDRRNDDIGPAIREGEPFTDDFDKCEMKWARLMAGARFDGRGGAALLRSVVGKAKSS